MAVFILNDESVLTSHGFLILNSGGEFDRFRANPVMLNSHDERGVIGRWHNLTIEGSTLQAEAEFDADDAEALKISGKVERGFIKGASMGLIILDAEMRELPVLGYQVVITRWELLEASPVAVPSNKGALRLYAKNGKALATNEITLSIESILNKKNNMEKIMLSAEAAKALGVSKDPEITELNAAIMELSARAERSIKEKEKAEKELSDHRSKQATDLVNLAVSEGKITADKKEAYVKLAIADYKQAKDILDTLPGSTSFSSKLGGFGNNKQAADREGWDYMKWLKEDQPGLAEMAIKDPEGHAALKASYKSKY
jgi:HK97 family phage prohead protease